MEEGSCLVNVCDLDGNVRIIEFGRDVQEIPGYPENTHVHRIGIGDYLTVFNGVEYRSLINGRTVEWLPLDEYEALRRYDQNEDLRRAA